jgi:hypothetical protein
MYFLLQWNITKKFQMSELWLLLAIFHQFCLAHFLYYHQHTRQTTSNSKHNHFKKKNPIKTGWKIKILYIPNTFVVCEISVFGQLFKIKQLSFSNGPSVTYKYEQFTKKTLKIGWTFLFNYNFEIPHCQPLLCQRLWLLCCFISASCDSGLPKYFLKLKTYRDLW